MFRICIIVWAVLSFIGVAFVFRNPEYTEAQKKSGKKTFNDGQSLSVRSSQKVAIQDADFIPLKDSFRTIQFWQLFVMYMCGTFFSIYNASVYKTNA